MEAPIWLYAFWAPIHESSAVQVMLVAVSILIVADLVFGMVGAIVQKNFQSTKIREGLAHKCAEFAFIVIADVIDALLYGGVSLPFEIPNGSAMMVVGVALIVMEIASLMEIATRINPKLADNPLFRILDDAHIIHAVHEEGASDGAAA
jgi:toxin secretion/phage lysis holin